MSRKRLGKILKTTSITIKRMETGELMDIEYSWLRQICKMFRVDSHSMLNQKL